MDTLEAIIKKAEQEQILEQSQHHIEQIPPLVAGIEANLSGTRTFGPIRDHSVHPEAAHGEAHDNKRNDHEIER